MWAAMLPDVQTNKTLYEILDDLEDKNKFLKVRNKQCELEVADWRSISCGLAHGLALYVPARSSDLWVLEAYRRWENKWRGYIGV